MPFLSVGDAASRSRWATSGSAAGGLSVCSPSIPRNGEQPAVFRCLKHFSMFILGLRFTIMVYTKCVFCITHYH